MRKLLAVFLLASSLSACIDPSQLPKAPDDRSFAWLADVCHDELWRTITPRGLINPKACPVRGPERKPVYHSTFPKASAGCCLVDLFSDGPKELVVGESHFAKTASGDLASGAMALGVTNILQDTDKNLTKSPSAGFFRTGLSFGPDANFAVLATFRNPEGPRNSTAWSVSVVARDGGVDDAYDAKRLSVTLRVKLGSASLNIGAGALAATKPDAADIGEKLYRSIFDEDEPFTLRLYVDRPSGEGTAALMRDGVILSILRFDLEDALKDPAFSFTTAGATLTDCCVEKADLSAEVTDFQIWNYKP